MVEASQSARAKFVEVFMPRARCDELGKGQEEDENTLQSRLSSFAGLQSEVGWSTDCTEQDALRPRLFTPEPSLTATLYAPCPLQYTR